MKDTHAHDAAVADTELSLRLNNLCLQVLSRIVCTSVRYSRVSHPKADTASGISNSGSHFMATYVRYSIPIAKLPSGNVFPEVHSSISFPCCQKLAIHPYKRNLSYCHLRFLLCKGIAALADDKQRSMTRYRQQ